MHPTTLSISLYPAHLAAIDTYAEAIGISGTDVHSVILQKIVEEWAAARGHFMVGSTSERPIPMHAGGIAIGYLQLSDLVVAFDITQPVYVASRVEITTGTVSGQRIDRYFIVVTQPDAQNRVHYCRIPVVQLVYHNGVAFAPDTDAQLAEVEEKRREIEAWLVGEGYQMQSGMVGLPDGIVLIEGNF